MGRDFEFLEAARLGDVLYFEKFFANKKSRPLTSLRRGPNSNTHDSSGYNALHHAALNGHLEIVKILLVHDANPNLLDGRGSSPLHLAAWAGHTSICRLLLSSPNTVIGSANPNALTLQRETPLHFAAQFGHVKVVATLLEYEADPDILTLYGETPLDLAAKFGRMDVVQLMVYAFPDSAPFGNVTPLHLAARNGHKTVCEFLLDTGYVSVNASAPDGSTPLHEAIISGHLEICKLLIAHGANCHVRNANGETIADLLDQFPVYVVEEFREILKNGTNPLYYSKSDYEERYSIPEPRKREKSPNDFIENEKRLNSMPPKKPPRRSTGMSKSMDDCLFASENSPLDQSWHIKLAHDYCEKTSDFFLVSYNKNRRLRRLQFGNIAWSTVIKSEDIPTSPTYYDQPPTPTHPPPAPALAEKKIFEKLRPLSAEYYLGYCAPSIQWEFYFEADKIKFNRPEKQCNRDQELVFPEEWTEEIKNQIQELLNEINRELYPEVEKSSLEKFREWMTSNNFNDDLVERLLNLGFDNLDFLNQICTKEILQSEGLTDLSGSVDRLQEFIKELPVLQDSQRAVLTEKTRGEELKDFLKGLDLTQYFESVNLFFECPYWRSKLSDMSEKESGLWLGIVKPGHLRRFWAAARLEKRKKSNEEREEEEDKSKQVLTATGQELGLPDELGKVLDGQEVDVQVMFNGYLATLTISNQRIEISKMGTKIIEHRHNLRDLKFICQDGEDLTKFGYNLTDGSFWEFQTSSIFTSSQIMVIIAQRFGNSSNSSNSEPENAS